MDKKVINLEFKEMLKEVMRLIKCYIFEIFYLLLVFFCVWNYQEYFLQHPELITAIATLLPLPIAMIKYIKETDVKTKIEVLDENLLFDNELLKNSKMSRYRKLIYRVSIIKDSIDAKHFKEAAVRSLIEMVDKAFDKRTFPTKQEIQNEFEEIDKTTGGLTKHLGKEYTIDKITQKFFEYNKICCEAVYDKENTLNKLKSMFNENNELILSPVKFINCEFTIGEESKKFLLGIPEDSFELFFYSCKFFDENKNEIENIYTYFDSQDEINETSENKVNDSSKIIKKSRDYRKDGDNIYLAKSWFIIREIDFNTKYDVSKNILFNIYAKDDNKIYPIEFTYEQLADLISYKYPDTRGNYHFYFWIKKDKNKNMYLIDGRNGLNKRYFLGEETENNNYKIIKED